MKTFTPSGNSIWNNKQGWTCEALPTLANNEIAVVIQVKNGIPQSQMRERLENVGLGNTIYYFGKNDPKLAKETNLIYLAKVCNSYSDLLETVGVLQSLHIPVNFISAITHQLQRLAIFKPIDSAQPA
jgi:hypothetical protein